MVYEKQNFENGKVLDASELNHIEDGIVNLETSVGKCLTAETDPTVPEWAKASEKPTYTAAEVGADASGTASGLVSNHNTDATAHADIRNRIVMTNIVETVRDDAATVSDSSGMELAGLCIFGKTIQNGTPAPEAPVSLESVGDGGSVNVMLTNSNILSSPYSAGDTLEANGLKFEVQKDGSILVNGTATAETFYALARASQKNLYLPKGTYTFSGMSPGNFGGTLRPQFWVSNGSGVNFSVYAEGKTVEITEPGYYGVSIDIVKNNTLSDFVVKPMINIGETALPFEAPTSPQNIEVSTPNGLPGIPVASGGNYADSNGQQWICDEVDVGKGMYIQRVKSVKLSDMTGGHNGTNFYLTATSDKKPGQLNLLCSHYPVLPGYQSSGVRYCRGGRSDGTLYIYDSQYTNFNALKADHGDMLFVYELAEPISRPLSEADPDALTQFATLHTNYPNTTVLNDGDAGTELRYHADTKTYLDQHVLPGSKMQGLNVAIIGDSISTNGTYGNGQNAVEITIEEADVGVSLSAYITKYDVDNGLRIGGYTFTASDIGTEKSFTPSATDVGKVVGRANIYNSAKMNVWWEHAATALGFQPIPVCWSGSSITSHESDKTAYACGHAWHESQIRKCGIRTPGTMERTAPDVIIIYRGVNDFSHSPYVKLTDGYFDAVEWEYPNTDAISDGYGFLEGYTLLIQKLRSTYPKAKIFLCTLTPFKRVNFTQFPTNNGLYSLPRFNRAIREIADFMGCDVIEMDKAGLTFENIGSYTLDASNPTHPNNKGHAILARKAIAELTAKFSSM